MNLSSNYNNPQKCDKATIKFAKREMIEKFKRNERNESEERAKREKVRRKKGEKENLIAFNFKFLWFFRILVKALEIVISIRPYSNSSSFPKLICIPHKHQSP